MNANQYYQSAPLSAVTQIETPEFHEVHAAINVIKDRVTLNPLNTLPARYVQGSHVYKTKNNEKHYKPEDLKSVSYAAHALDYHKAHVKAFARKARHNANYLANKNQRFRRPVTLADFVPEELKPEKPKPIASNYGFNIHAPVFVPKNRVTVVSQVVTVKTETPKSRNEDQKSDKVVLSRAVTTVHPLTIISESPSITPSPVFIKRPGDANPYNPNDRPTFYNLAQEREYADPNSGYNEMRRRQFELYLTPAHEDAVALRCHLRDDEDPVPEWKRYQPPDTESGYIAQSSRDESWIIPSFGDDHVAPPRNIITPDPNRLVPYRDVSSDSEDDCCPICNSPLPSGPNIIPAHNCFDSRISPVEVQAIQAEMELFKIHPEVNPDIPVTFSTPPEAPIPDIEDAPDSLRSEGVSRYIAFRLIENQKYVEVKNVDRNGFTIYALNEENMAVRHQSFNGKFHPIDIPKELLPSFSHYVRPKMGTPRQNKRKKYVAQMMRDPIGIQAATEQVKDALSDATSKNAQIASDIVKQVSDSISRNTNLATDTINTFTQAFNDNTSRLVDLITDLKKSIISTVSDASFRIFEKIAGLLLIIWACDRVEDTSTRAIMLAGWATSCGLMSTVVSHLSNAISNIGGAFVAQASISEMFTSIVEVVGSIMDVPYTKIIDSKLKTCSRIHQIAQGMKGSVDIVKMITSAYNYVLRTFFGIVPEAQEIYDETHAWCDRVREMLREDVNQKLFDSPTYKTEFEQLLARGDELATELCTIKTQDATLSYRNLSDARNALKHYKEALDKVKAAQAHHYEAVGIHYFGKPGVGKSNLISYVCADLYDRLFDRDEGIGTLEEEKFMLPKAKPRDLTNADLYPWNTNSEYFAEYRSQKFFIADDPFQLDNELIRSKIGMEFIHFINVQPYSLNQAELERKGKVFFDSEVVIVSTNSKTFPQNMKVEDPGAVYRRFDDLRFEVTVNPKFGMNYFDQKTQTTYQKIDERVARDHINCGGDHCDAYQLIKHSTDSNGSAIITPVTWEEHLELIEKSWRLKHAASANPLLDRHRYNRLKKAAAAKAEDKLAKDLEIPQTPGEYNAQAKAELKQAKAAVFEKLTILISNLKLWLTAALKDLASALYENHKKILATIGGLGALYFVGRHFARPAMTPSGDPRTVVATRPRLVGPRQGTPAPGSYVAQVQDPGAVNILVNSIAKNVYRANWSYDDPVTGDYRLGGGLHVTFIKEKTFITAKHWLGFRGSYPFLHLANPWKTFRVRFEDLVVRDWPHMPDGIIVTITAPQFPKQKDISNHIMTYEDFTGDISDVVTLHYDTMPDKTLMPRACTGNAKYMLKHLNYSQDQTNYTLKEYVSIGIQGDYGHCGKIYVVMNTRMERKILAMHVSGHSHYVESIAAPMYELLDPSLYVAQSSFELKIPPQLENCGTLPPNQVPRLPSHTSIRKSMFATYMEERGFKPATTPARLAPGIDKEGNLKSPAQVGLDKYPARIECPLSPEDQELLIECCHSVARDIPIKVRPNDTKVSLKDAINGKKNWPNSKKINMKTAVGYPFVLTEKDKKWSFLECESCPPEKKCRDGTHTLKANAKFTKILDDLTEKIDSCDLDTPEGTEKLCGIIKIMNCLKDERTKFKKYDEFNTRIFNIMPVDFFIKKREYFMVFVENMMADPVNSFSALGINCHSPDWGNLAKRICKKFNWPGDFKFFDGSHQQWLQRMVYEHCILYWFELHFSDTIDFERKQLFRKKLSMMTYESIYVMFNLLYRSRGSNPSGDYLTTVVNNCVNAVSQRFAAVKAARMLGIPSRSGGLYQLSDYIQDFEQSTFGDDHNESSDEGWYTMQLKAQFLALLGLGYTNPDKTPITDDSPKSFAAHEVQYLKRYMVERLAYTYAPLPEQIIDEILYWMKDENISKDLWARSAAMSTMLEAVHHGEAFFNKKRKFILDMFAHFRIAVSLPTFFEADCKLRSGGYYADERGFAMSMDAPTAVADTEDGTYVAQSKQERVTHKYQTAYQRRKQKEKIEINGTKYSIPVPPTPTFVDLTKPTANIADSLKSFTDKARNYTTDLVGLLRSSLGNKFAIVEQDLPLVKELEKLSIYMGSDALMNTIMSCAIGTYLGDKIDQIQRGYHNAVMFDPNLVLSYFDKVNPTIGDSYILKFLNFVWQLVVEMQSFVTAVVLAPLGEEVFREFSNVLGICEFFIHFFSMGANRRAMALSIPALIMHTFNDFLTCLFSPKRTFPIRVAIHAFYNFLCLVSGSKLVPGRALLVSMYGLLQWSGFLCERDVSVLLELYDTENYFYGRVLLPNVRAMQHLRYQGFLYDKIETLRLDTQTLLKHFSRGDDPAELAATLEKNVSYAHKYTKEHYTNQFLDDIIFADEVQKLVTQISELDCAKEMISVHSIEVMCKYKDRLKDIIQLPVVQANVLVRDCLAQYTIDLISPIPNKTSSQQALIAGAVRVKSACEKIKLIVYYDDEEIEIIRTLANIPESRDEIQPYISRILEVSRAPQPHIVVDIPDEQVVGRPKTN